MTVGESLCFAIYHFGTRMKGLAALLISSFPSEITDIVLLGVFFAWDPPWKPGPGRNFSRSPAFATEVTLGEVKSPPWAALRFCSGEAPRELYTKGSIDFSAIPDLI